MLRLWIFPFWQISLRNIVESEKFSGFAAHWLHKILQNKTVSYTVVYTYRTV